MAYVGGEQCGRREDEGGQKERWAAVAIVSSSLTARCSGAGLGLKLLLLRGVSL